MDFKQGDIGSLIDLMPSNIHEQDEKERITALVVSNSAYTKREIILQFLVPIRLLKGLV